MSYRLFTILSGIKRKTGLPRRANPVTRPLPALAFGSLLAGGLLTVPTAAQAQEGASTGTYERLPEFEGFTLDEKPSWSLGLEGIAGLAVETGGEGTRGHAIAGGLSRVRLGYVDFGAGLEMSDVALERWRQVGVFVGGFFPIVNWVDFDTSIGIAQRNYLSSDTRYGPGGMDVRGAALTYRLGFTDRILDERLGVRLGGALLFGIDLKHHEVPWSYENGRYVVTGTTQVGGVSVALAACVGFDVIVRRPAR